MKNSLLTLTTASLLMLAASGVRADETINFEGLSAGTIVSQVFSDGGAGPVGVYGTNPLMPAMNAAMIFDSSNPTGEDDDLGSPNQTCPGGGPGIGVGGEVGSPYENCTALGKVLIVTEDFDSGDPDDFAAIGAKQELDFSALGTVSIKSMTIIDVEGSESPAVVELFGPGDVKVAEFDLPSTGNNGVATSTLGPTDGVEKMLVRLRGSGGIDNIVFTTCGNDVREGSEACDGSDDEMCPGACTAECTCENQPYCGDGNVDQGEECDDGNNVDNDGCSANCETEEGGGEGCTPGYWKQPHHFDSWVGATPADLFNTVFDVNITFNPDKCGAEEITLLQGLRCHGGGRNALARHAVAALLNALTDGVDSGLTPDQVKMIVKTAIDSGSRSDMIAAKDLLAGYNEQECPLN